MPHHTMTCSHCGSDEVVRDAWASWDSSTEQWVLDNVFDYAYCTNCEGDCRIIDSDNLVTKT